MFFCFVASLVTFAQRIQGKITDQNKKPVSDSEIILTKNEKKASALTDEKGNYQIALPETGVFIVEIVRDGEKIYNTEIQINGDTTKDIEIKLLEISEAKVEGIVLSGRKKLVERKVDRLVFNIENSVASQGIDAVEALGKTPMVRTTDDAISIAGKSNVAIMINDRLLNISGDELINYLKTIRSDDIAKIEVITTPPAKYEAEGKSGLINIILKKNTSLGWNASIQTSGTYFWGRPTVSTRNGASFNYQGKKLSVSANLSQGDNFWEMKSYTHNSGTGTLWNTDTNGRNNYRYKGGNVKSEYKINEHNLIGFNYNYSYSNPIDKSSSITEIRNEEGDRKILSDINNQNHRKVHNATLFYELKIDTLGSKLSLSANLMDSRSNAENYNNTNVTSIISSTYANPINQYKIYSGQADLEKNFEKLKTEAGLKYTKIQNNSDFNFFDINNGIKEIDLSNSNTFLYNEANYAAYLSANYKISEKWDAKIGLRYEHTTMEGISSTANLTSKREYGKFFPTAYLSYKPNDNHSFSLNYSRRISRPYFGALNPFRYYSSDFEYSTGNPYLLPSFTDNLELSYVLKNNFTTTLYYNYNKDNWDRIQRIEGNTKYSITMNFYNENQAGISMNYNFNKLKWLESNFFATAYYSESKSYVADAVDVAGAGANFNFDNNFFLKKDKTFSLLLGMWANLPNRSGNTDFDMNCSVYTGMKWSLMQKNLLINLYVNDIFNTNESKGTEYYKDFSSLYSYKGVTRNAYLSITYKFGNNNVQGATKQVKFEEQNRAN